MAVIPSILYPTQIISSDLGWPWGRAQNDGTPGDGAGTPLEAAWVSDLFGWEQALLSEAGLTPSGNPDEVGASQYMAALRAIFATKASDTRMPDEARGIPVARTGLLLPSHASPGLHDASTWGRQAMSWQAQQATAENGLFFNRTVPKGFTLTSLTMRFAMPAHGTWPPANAPKIYVRRHNMSSLAYDQIAYEAIPITDQATYEGLTSWTIACDTNNVFSEDYHSLSVAFYPEYGADAVYGTIVHGGTIYGTTDRGRVL